MAKGFFTGFSSGFIQGRGARDRREAAEERAAQRQADIDLRKEQFEETKRQNTIGNVFRKQTNKREQDKFELDRRTKLLEIKQKDFQVKSSLIDMAKIGGDPKIIKLKAIESIKSLGGDPDAPHNKLFIDTIVGMNDQSRQQLTDALGAIGPDAPPGMLTGIITAMAKGKMTFTQALDALETAGKRSAEAAEQAAKTSKLEAETRKTSAEAVGQESVNKALEEFKGSSDPNLISKINEIFSSGEFGPLKINSGRRSPGENRKVGGAPHSQHLKGKAFDIDVTNLPVDQRVELIRSLRAKGIGGIGVGQNIIHADTGRVRAWGYKDGKATVGGKSVPPPAWAKDALKVIAPGDAPQVAPTSLFEKRILELTRLAERTFGHGVSDDARAQIRTMRASPEGQKLSAETKKKVDIAFASAEAEAEEVGKARAELSAPVPPRDLNFLGIDITSKLSRRDLATLGYVLPAEEVKVSLLGKEAALKKIMRSINRIIVDVENNPKLLSAPGFIARSLVSVERGVKGLFDLLPESIISGTRADRINSVISKRLDGLEEVASMSSQVKSTLQSIVFQGAILAGQSGRSQSDRDLERVTDILATATANDQAMVAVLRSFILSSYEGFQIDFETSVHRRKELKGIPDISKPFSDLSDESFESVLVPLLPDTQFKLWEEEGIRRLEAQQ